jgi:molybdenum cofactor cytidylyltransferase
MSGTGITILAAGNSSRLGRPKQLLPYQNKSLLEHITSEAIKAKLYPVVVVTGANAGQVSVPLYNKDVTIVYNERWVEGMASGIVAGLSKALLINDKLQNVIIAVCDQPFVSAALFRELINIKEETGKGIVACTYAGTIGTPVLFHHTYFRELQSLKGSEGAKGIVKKYIDYVATVSFPHGSIDIDTEEDYQNLLNQEQ